jgi:nucleotide-binding universal stress UspA family protein
MLCDGAVMVGIAGGSLDRVLGSLGQQVLRHAPCAVVVAR